MIGRVHINKIALLKELVHGKGQPAAHAKDGAKQIRARPQMRDRAQKFLRVPLFLQRVVAIRLADQFHVASPAIPISDPERAREPDCLRLSAEAPVLNCGKCSEPGVPASTTTWRLARHEPSLSSRKENPSNPGASDPTLNGYGFLGFGCRQNIFNQASHWT